MKSEYAEETMRTMQAPGSYFGFNKYDTAAEARDAYQIAPEWCDSRLRGEFDTLQVIDGMYVPKSRGGTGPDLEPFATSYPEHGKGGAQQFMYEGTIKFNKVDLLENE